MKNSLFTDLQKQMFTDGGVKRYLTSDIVDTFGADQSADISFPNGYNKGKRVHDYMPSLNDTTTKSNFVYKDTKLRIRKLTPCECWRLMGFAEKTESGWDDTAFKKAEEVNSNSQLYKQAGNSIVVDVLYYIFKELIDGHHSS